MPPKTNEARKPVLELPKEIRLAEIEPQIVQLSKDPRRVASTIFSSSRGDHVYRKNGDQIKLPEEQANCLELEVIKAHIKVMKTKESADPDSLLDQAILDLPETGSRVVVASYAFEDGFVVHVSRHIENDPDVAGSIGQLTGVTVSAGWAPLPDTVSA